MVGLLVSSTKNSVFAIAVVAIVIAASVSGGMFYFLVHAPQANSGPSSLTTGTTIYHSSIVTTTCNQAAPLTLVSATEPQENFGSGPAPALHLTWANCSSQSIKFIMTGGNVSEIVGLKVTITTYGQTSTVDADIGNNAATFTVGAQFQATVDVPIYLGSQVSPNAVIQHVTGNVTANDPATYQQISQFSNFRT